MVLVVSKVDRVTFPLLQVAVSETASAVAVALALADHQAHMDLHHKVGKVDKEDKADLAVPVDHQAHMDHHLKAVKVDKVDLGAQVDHQAHMELHHKVDKVDKVVLAVPVDPQAHMDLHLKVVKAAKVAKVVLEAPVDPLAHMDPHHKADKVDLVVPAGPQAHTVHHHKAVSEVNHQDSVVARKVDLAHSHLNNTVHLKVVSLPQQLATVSQLPHQPHLEATVLHHNKEVVSAVNLVASVIKSNTPIMSTNTK